MITQRTIAVSVLFFFVAISNTLADPAFLREHHFSTDVSKASWENQQDLPYLCQLLHQISDYGKVSFIARAGRPSRLSLENWQGLASSTTGMLKVIAPAWRHNITHKDLGTVELQAGNHILMLNQQQTQNALSVLSAGLSLRLIYEVHSLGSERIYVDISPVAWQQAFIEYNQCVSELLPYNFDDLKVTNLYFDNNSEDLTLDTRRKLNKILHYIKESNQKESKKVGKIILKGYTNHTGRYSHNRRLAGRRAESVKKYLIDNGFPKAMIEIQDVFTRYRLMQTGNKGRRVNLEMFKQADMPKKMDEIQEVKKEKMDSEMMDEEVTP